MAIVTPLGFTLTGSTTVSSSLSTNPQCEKNASILAIGFANRLCVAGNIVHQITLSTDQMMPAPNLRISTYRDKQSTTAWSSLLLENTQFQKPVI